MNEKLNRQMRRFDFLANEIDAAYHEAAQQLGLTDSAFHILYTAYSGGGKCTIGEICARGCAKQTVNSALRRLESEGNIYLESDGGKRKRVCLTEKGRQLAMSTVVKIMEIENDIFASWGESEVAAYVELTERYLKMFKESIGRISG